MAGDWIFFSKIVLDARDCRRPNLRPLKLTIFTSKLLQVFISNIDWKIGLVLPGRKTWLFNLNN